MENIRLSQENYTDYSAIRYFEAMGVEKLGMTLKTITVKDTGEIIPLVHLTGIQKCSGVILNVDIWPRNSATKEDLDKLPKSVNEMYFRIGVATVNGVDIISQPKWLVLNPGDTAEFKLSGEKREYNG